LTKKCQRRHLRQEGRGDSKPKLHDEKVLNLRSSPNIIRAIKSRTTRWAGDVPSTVQGKGVYRALAAKLEGKKALGIWEYTIRIYFQEISLEVVDRIDLAQDMASGGFAYRR